MSFFVPARGRKTSQCPLPAPGWQLRSRCPCPLLMSHSSQFDLSILRISVSGSYDEGRLWWTLPWFTPGPQAARGGCVMVTGGGGREREARKARTRSFHSRGLRCSRHRADRGGLRAKEVAGSGGRKAIAGESLGREGAEGCPVTPSASPTLREAAELLPDCEAPIRLFLCGPTPHPVGPTREGGPAWLPHSRDCPCQDLLEHAGALAGCQQARRVRGR